MVGMRKVYPPRGQNPPHTAFCDFTLGIPQGECFGLLGPNGAGKTSLMKALTGDVCQDVGKAYVAGYDISTQMEEVHKVMGYCPQFDSLWGELTGREHLEIYAEIKGIRSDRVQRVVTNVIDRMELTQYADMRSEQYSGGNRRKLSVALALFSDPKVVYLDEPSTGMDPAAKRSMWDLISSTMAGRAVILTTHSMEEADALCGNIGIMVNGRLVCLGSGQHLKSTYGSGYQLELKSDESTGDKCHQFVLNLFRGAYLTDTPYGGLRSYYLPADGVNLATAFAELEGNRQELKIEDYSLGQTSLEQVFISFAKKQKEDPNAA
eukprot:GFYU01007075.1.p1 GENE.GFYU01007075.1~~GFYU01007075.1.p1  ORF type:complete len:370 (-),score=136.61 GFYU01007075.1:270-1232(-)